jgi:hypothetical protein
MLYLCFEEYSNRLELLSTALKLKGVGSNPRRGKFFISYFFFLTLFMYISDPLWKEKSVLI